MIRRRRALTAVAIGGIPILASVGLVSQAGAHGSMQSPVSRTYACFLDGPESPDSLTGWEPPNVPALWLAR